MKKHSQLILGLTLVLVVFLSACGTNVPAVDSTPSATSVPDTSMPEPATSTPEPATSTPEPVTSTPDPCAPENIEAEVMKVHKYMREFDDMSTLAASLTANLTTNLTSAELINIISELQRIRREAQDQDIPYCLGDLKTYQLSHMNAVINTLIALMSGAERQTADQSITLARQLHDQYTIELARVLGLTIESATVIPPPTETPATPTP